MMVEMKFGEERERSRRSSEWVVHGVAHRRDGPRRGRVGLKKKEEEVKKN